MNERSKRAGAAIAPYLKRLGAVLTLYLDDLLLLGAGTCFVLAASELSRAAALVVAGGCLLGYAVVIARARRGGSGG